MDKQELIDFAPLQGKLAQDIGLNRQTNAQRTSVVLMCEENGKIFTRSDACIQVASMLGGPFRWLCLARLIPKTFRDRIYERVAYNRRRLVWPGDSCSLPDRSWLKRLRE